jgi:hypothetical protein
MRAWLRRLREDRRHAKLLGQVTEGKISLNQARSEMGLPPWELPLGRLWEEPLGWNLYSSYSADHGGEPFRSIRNGG